MKQSKKILVLSKLEWTGRLWIYEFPNGHIGTFCKRVGRTDAMRGIARKNRCNTITLEGAGWEVSA